MSFFSMTFFYIAGINSAPTLEKARPGKKKAFDNYVHDNDVGDLEPDANEENRKDT
jgi:hypothetical protein